MSASRRRSSVPSRGSPSVPATNAASTSRASSGSSASASTAGTARRALAASPASLRSRGPGTRAPRRTPPPRREFEFHGLFTSAYRAVESRAWSRLQTRSSAACWSTSTRAVVRLSDDACPRQPPASTRISEASKLLVGSSDTVASRAFRRRSNDCRLRPPVFPARRCALPVRWCSFRFAESSPVRRRARLRRRSVWDELPIRAVGSNLLSTPAEPSSPWLFSTRCSVLAGSVLARPSTSFVVQADCGSRLCRWLRLAAGPASGRCPSPEGVLTACAFHALVRRQADPSGGRTLAFTPVHPDEQHRERVPVVRRWPPP